MRLRFTPLFFLPRPALRWAYDQACFERLMDTPFVAFFITVDKSGIWFPYKGDEVLWTYPWRRKGLAPFVSVGFSGTGDFGDARFWSLKEMDEQWEAFEEASEALGKWVAGEVDKRAIELLTKPSINLSASVDPWLKTYTEAFDKINERT